jgi:uncharacterized protein (DUF305 family)
VEAPARHGVKGTWHAGEADNRNLDNDLWAINRYTGVNVETLTSASINEQNPVVKANARILLAGALTATLLGLPGCSATTGAPAQPASPARSAVAFGGTDLAWIEINIAMDEELLPLLALTSGHGRDAAVKALASQVKGFTDAELNTLRALHDQAGLPAENPHEGMPMPGMVTPELVDQAAALSGTAFDALLVKQIRAHLQQGAKLAESESKSGIEAQTLALAAQVLSTRTKVLSTIA